MELIVSVPFAQIPRRVPRRKNSSTSSQSSTRSATPRRTRQWQRRKRRRSSKASASQELIVKIPVRHIDDRTYLGLLGGSFSEGTEDSDVPSTIEQVAASMQPPKPKRTPQIIRLEPHFDLGSPPPQPQIIYLEPYFNLASPPPPPPQPPSSPKVATEPEVEVAEYCSEVIAPTASVLCSQHHLDSCLSELLDVVQEMKYSNCVADGGTGLACLDVGDEVELGEPSEDTCACEVTGMDLLNLSDHNETPEMETCETDESNSPNPNCKVSDQWSVYHAQ